MVNPSDPKVAPEEGNALLEQPHIVTDATEQWWRLLRSTKRSFEGLEKFWAETLHLHHNPKYKRNFELAIRAGICCCFWTRPLLKLPIFPAFDDFLQHYIEVGAYSAGILTFLVFNLQPTLGHTIENSFNGVKGCAMAVMNAWFLALIFPDGVTPTSPSYVFWFGAIEGALFTAFVLFLQFDNNVVMWCISYFVGYWMAFLTPKDSHIIPPFKPGFLEFHDQGTRDIVGILVGAFICLLVVLLPYPLLALDRGRHLASDVTENLPKVLENCIDFFSADRPDFEKKGAVEKSLKHLSTLSAELPTQISKAWWESWFIWRAEHVRRSLQSLDKTLAKCYARVYSIQCVIDKLEEGAEWKKHHKDVMATVKPHMIPAISQMRKLLFDCLQASTDGVLTDEEDRSITTQIAEAEKVTDALWKAFLETRWQMCKDLADPVANKLCLEELDDLHVLVFGISRIMRRVITFAQDLQQQKKDHNHLPQVTDPPHLITSLFQGISDPAHLALSFRICLSIYLCFLLGYTGYDDMLDPYSAGLASLAIYSVGRFQGSALSKSLQRVQGVVLGTIFGQVVHQVFSGCDFVRTGLLELSLFWLVATGIFVRFHSVQSSFLAMLTAALGCKQIVAGGCGKQLMNKAESYDAVLQVILCVAILTAVDMALSRTRASDLAAAKLIETFEKVSDATNAIFKQDAVVKHEDELIGAINFLESLGEAAAQEPRHWRVDWPAEAYSQCCTILRQLVFSLSSVESSLRKCDGESDVREVRQLLGRDGGDLQKILKKQMLAAIASLKFFQHETSLTFIAEVEQLENEEALEKKRVLAELLELASKDEGAKPIRKPTKPTFKESQDDFMCCVCVVLASLNSILNSMQLVERAIIRAA